MWIFQTGAPVPPHPNGRDAVKRQTIKTQTVPPSRYKWWDSNGDRCRSSHLRRHINDTAAGTNQAQAAGEEWNEFERNKGNGRTRARRFQASTFFFCRCETAVVKKTHDQAHFHAHVKGMDGIFLSPAASPGWRMERVPERLPGWGKWNRLTGIKTQGIGARRLWNNLKRRRGGKSCEINWRRVRVNVMMGWQARLFSAQTFPPLNLVVLKTDFVSNLTVVVKANRYWSGGNWVQLNLILWLNSHETQKQQVLWDICESEPEPMRTVIEKPMC